MYIHIPQCKSLVSWKTYGFKHQGFKHSNILYMQHFAVRPIGLVVFGSTVEIVSYVPYRTKVWQEKSLANLANFTKSPNFIHQTSYNSTTIISVLMFSPNFITPN